MAKTSKDVQSTSTSIKPVTTRDQFDLALYSQEDIQSHIYTIRGQHVMLDSDIARLYGMETKRINEQVRRNPIKFPERYVFQLSAEEVESLRSQNATSNPLSRSQDATLKDSEFTEVIDNQKEMLVLLRPLLANFECKFRLEVARNDLKTALSLKRNKWYGRHYTLQTNTEKQFE